MRAKQCPKIFYYAIVEGGVGSIQSELVSFKFIMQEIMSLCFPRFLVSSSATTIIFICECIFQHMMIKLHVIFPRR